MSKGRMFDGHEKISGLVLEKEILSAEEEANLISAIDQEKWNTSISRRTQHYGYIYNYMEKNAREVAPPIPKWCHFLVDRLIERGLMKVTPDQMIVNEYIPGQGIAAHVDNIRAFEDGIVSVSLGWKVPMEFSRAIVARGEKLEKVEVYLSRRSAVALYGEARYLWRHGIAARKSDNNVSRERRISLTFRKIKE